MPAANEASVRTLLAGTGHLNGGADALEAFWDGVIPLAMDHAEAWLRTTLAGFGKQAIARWPMFEHYHRQLSVYWSSIYGAANLTDDQRTLLQKLDCRDEVKALESLGDDPDTDTDDAVSGGRMRRSDDLFAEPSVNADGSIPASILNTPRSWCGRDVWR